MNSHHIIVVGNCARRCTLTSSKLTMHVCCVCAHECSCVSVCIYVLCVHVCVLCARVHMRAYVYVYVACLSMGVECV